MLSLEEAKKLAFQLKLSAEYGESVQKIHSTILTGKTDINLKDIGFNIAFGVNDYKIGTVLDNRDFV